DAIRSGSLMCRVLADAVVEGRFIAEHRRKNAPPAAEETNTGPSPRSRRVPPPPPVAPQAETPEAETPQGESPPEAGGPSTVDDALQSPVEAELAEVATGAVEA